VGQHHERTADKEQILRELFWLRHQLDSIAGTPAVTGAWRLAAEVMPVLEPVWSIVGIASAEVEAVGFLREYGKPAAAQAAGANAVVTQHAVLTFGALDLTAPSRREVWDAMERPAQALINSVDLGSGDIGQPGTLRPRYSPRLPAGFLTDWPREDEVVPALRRILRTWCEIARHATGDRRDVAELLLAAAQLARGAALDGDMDTMRWFVDRWLGLAPTESRVDGAVAALLADGWRRTTADRDLNAAQDAVADLRIRAAGLRSAARHQHRLHRPVWETELRGSPVALLSDPLLAFGDSGITADEVAASDDGNPVTAVTQIMLQEQMQSVLDTLSDREAGIMTMFAEGRSWAQMAKDLGVTRYRLDQVRERAFYKLRHPSRARVLQDYA
jgi:DNA-binding CsgD family transcriptional regulator